MKSFVWLRVVGRAFWALLMVFKSPCTMRGGSVRPEVVGPHIGGNVWFPPSHRESLLRLAPAQLSGLNRTRDAVVDLP